ncbi:M48 family metallopeptidase [Patescibacteria group bacterium]|nr:M48 family metallopeptidase [Patescibacteria group bacterium]
MYNQIAANRRKSLLLIALFVGVCAGAGYIYGLTTGTGTSGLIYALTISLVYTAFSWFFGDKMVLWTTGAQEIKNRDQNPYLWNLVENLSITAGIPQPKLYVIQDPALNAFATGRDPKHASIAVTSGIVQALENEELEGVIAHELSHVKNEDSKVMLLAAVLVGVLSLIGDGLLRSLFFRRDDREERGSLGTVGLVVGIAFIIISPLIGQLIQLAISRQREYLADASGALLTRYPEGLARALEKIGASRTPVARSSTATAHLWISNPEGNQPSFFQKINHFFSTHPPVEERIKRLRSLTQ